MPSFVWGLPAVDTDGPKGRRPCAGGRVIVVTHGGVLAQLHCLAAGHCSGAPSINCSINSLLVEPGRWALLRWGGVQHLQAGSYAAHAFGGGGRSG